MAKVKSRPRMSGTTPCSGESRSGTKIPWGRPRAGSIPAPGILGCRYVTPLADTSSHGAKPLTLPDLNVACGASPMVRGVRHSRSPGMQLT